MMNMLICGVALAVPLSWWWWRLRKANEEGRERGWWL